MGTEGALIIKETAPVGTRIAKLVVTDQKSSQVESGLTFKLISERVQPLPIFQRLPKRQIAQVNASTEVQDPNKHFTVSTYQCHFISLNPNYNFFFHNF